MTDLKDMADALNCQFQSVFSPIDSTALSANKSVIEMEDLTIDQNRVLKLLKELKMNKPTSPAH